MPVDLPLNAFTSLDLAPDLGVIAARSEGGLVITSRRFDPYWRGIFTTGPLDPRGDNERADFLAWLVWAADLNMRIDLVHPRHRYPSAYTATTWPMVGDGSLVSTPDMRTLNISGVPVGTLLRRRDRVSVIQDDIIVHRWIAADVEVASEISQSIPVTPRIPIGVLAPGATVVLENPKMRFAIVPGSWDDSQAEVYGPSPIAFEMMEALR